MVHKNYLKNYLIKPFRFCKIQLCRQEGRKQWIAHYSFYQQVASMPLLDIMLLVFGDIVKSVCKILVNIELTK